MVGFDLFEIRKYIQGAVVIALQEVMPCPLHLYIGVGGVYFFGYLKGFGQPASPGESHGILGFGIEINDVEKIVHIAIYVGAPFKIQHKSPHPPARIVESSVVHNGVKIIVQTRNTASVFHVAKLHLFFTEMMRMI